MRVAITIPWGERLGGAEEMIWLFLKHGDRARIQPIVVFLQDGPWEQDVAALGVETAVVPTGRLRNPVSTTRTITRLAGFLRQRKPDLLLNWATKTHLYGAPAAELAGMAHRLIWWQHGIPGRNWMDRLATRLPARAIGCSSLAAAHAQRDRLRPMRHTFVVHPGVEIPPHNDGQRARIRAQLGVRDDQPVLVTVGRLHPLKGQDRFVQALSILRRRGRDFRAVIVGGPAYGFVPEYEPYVKGLVRTLDLSDVVTFTGQVDDATDWVRAADCAVNASVNENLSLSILEGMALGVPYVAVGDGGSPEIIESGQSGLLIDEPSPDLLADAVEELLRDPLRLRDMGESARQTVQSRFSASHLADRLATSLEQMTSLPISRRSRAIR